MKDTSIDFSALRAQKARLGHRVGHGGYESLAVLAVIFLLFCPLLAYVHMIHMVWFSLAAALACYMPAAWYKYDLSQLPAVSGSLTDTLSAEVLALLTPGIDPTPVALWKLVRPHWQVNFILNHLLLDAKYIESHMSSEPSAMDEIWHKARQLAQTSGAVAIEPGHIAAALILLHPTLTDYLSRIRLGSPDVESVVDWLNRVLEIQRSEKPYFGGIGRDWANGFTPRLNEFGHNISLEIEKQGSSFEYLTTSPGVAAIKNAFSQGASAVALVGDTGIGKTSHVSALAQLLLEEKNDRNLEHRQIVALSASTIISSAVHPGELEQIVTMLLVETFHAGHIILFLDDAQLFFSNNAGAVDVTRILLPVLQSRNVQIVMAMTPHDYQALRAANPTFAGLLTPVMLAEPSETAVLRILEDTTLYLEHSHKVLISYDALREAYSLSGRYGDDLAYPGKAIRLLEHALSYAEHGGIITAGSVQKAIEQTHGVKVAGAQPAETDVLLHLEDKIHERMINQSQAVKVVAAALRRARAGIANPRRPIGSFLFLGPTGVGKTELAKAVAATYFGAESSMVRLDMSEYQQPEDVGRLLADGSSVTKSLILSVRQNPFTVVLLDEIEKAHPHILNLLLQLLDEGQLTDSGGRSVSFKDCVIIATSNAGADFIREHISGGQDISALQAELTDQLMSTGQFKPELLNRFDEIVVFRPLNPDELAQVVGLMMKDINQTLSAQKISVELTAEAVSKVVAAGYDPRLGARPMRRALQRSVEDGIAGRILSGETHSGDHVVLGAADLG